MKKLIHICLFFCIYANFTAQAQTTVPIAQTYPNAIDYVLPAHENHVSGGIYDLSGHLIRTAFSNISGEAGTHTYVWNGYDDDGNLQTIGTNFQLKVIYNNDTFTWATIGNTSLVDTGFHILKGGSQICGVVFTGTTMRRLTGFCEGVCSQSKAPASSPQQRATWSAQPNAIGQGSYFGCANGKWMAWGGWDYNRTKSFVFVERVSDETEKTFSASVQFSGSNGASRRYAALDTSYADIGGMAIQNSNNMFMYVTHPSLGSISISKMADSSGTTHVVPIVNTGPITLDTDGFLWVAQGTVTTKYSVNSTTGDLTSTGIQITGFSNIRGEHCQSGDLLVLDGGTQGVVKEYNSTTLSLVRTVGRVGGYATDPTVYNDKFYENDVRGNYYTYVVHDPSGGMWVGDPGNERSQHFDSSGNFVESVAYIPTYTTLTNGVNNGVSYNVNICGRQNTSIFSDFLEFNNDYSQPIGTGATLIKNWGYNLPVGWHNTGSVGGVFKYPNGREFAIVSKAGGGMVSASYYLAEFTSTGMQIIMSQIPSFSSFDKSGNLTNFSTTNSRAPASAPAVLTYKRYPVTVGSSGNPFVGGGVNIAVINSGYQDPLPQDTKINVTASNKIIVFDPGLTGTRNLSYPNKYFFSGYDSLTTTRLWRSGIGTFNAFRGDFPMDGTYDIGNQAQYGGGTQEVIGNTIIAGYHGEFWKQSETGMFWGWSDIGLLKWMFGVVGPQIVSGSAPYGFSGNTLATHATSSGGNIWLALNDENQHFAMSVWKIANTGSEGEYDSSPFALTNRYFSVPSNITDYLQTVPGGQVSIQGLSGWTQTPTTDVINYSSPNANGQFYTVTATNNLPGLSHDITFHATPSTPSALTNRQWKVNIPTAPTQWTFTGTLDLTRNAMVSFESSSIQNFIELTDNAGKAIARVYFYRTNRIKINNTYFGPFNQPKYGKSKFTIQRVQGTNNIYLTIDIWGTPVTYTGVMSDVTADITHVGAFSINVQNLNVGFQMSLNEFNGY